MISKLKKSKLTITLLSILLVISISLIVLTGCSLSPNKTSGSNTKDIDDVATNSTTSQTSSNSMESIPKEQSTTSSTDQNKESFYGDWVIKHVLAYGSAGTYSVKDAESLVGKNLSFSSDKASCFGDQLSDINKIIINPVYKKTVVSKNDFVINYRMTFDKLGIKTDSILEITASDSKGNGCTFFIKDDNTLIIYGGGTYFELNRKI